MLCYKFLFKNGAKNNIINTMETKIDKSYETDYYNLQGASTKPIKGILIYEEAQKKLNISDSGKLYLQKFYNYIPIIGPIIALVYANYCIGKTKCLRNTDQMLFKGLAKYINIWGTLVWPLIFLGFWTLLTFICVEFSTIGTINLNYGNFNISSNITTTISYGKIGNYAGMWQAVLVTRLNAQPITNVADFFAWLSILCSGLFYIFMFPLTFTNTFNISNAQINCNLIFILSIIVLTIINPVNIFNSCVLNSSKLRFVIVYEASSIYRYRQKYI